MSHGVDLHPLLLWLLSMSRAWSWIRLAASYWQAGAAQKRMASLRGYIVRTAVPPGRR